MSVLLQCQRVSHAVGTKTLFRDINLSINAGDKIGLVGHNGSGKSTLFSLLNHTAEADSGDFTRGRDLRMETVEQFIADDLLDFSLSEALAEKLPAEERDTGRYRVDQLLASLGFSEAEHQHRVGDLSGGQQNRLMFARAIMNEPTLILFDEPTNHLDLKTLLIFERTLKSMSSAFLIISHDRAFLDAVTSKTVFLRDERLYQFDLPFSAAKQALEDHDAAAEAAREVEEKNIKRVEASAKRLAIWGKTYDNEKLARKAKSMEKRVEKMKEDRTFVSRGSGLHLSIDVGTASANRMLAIEGRDIVAPDNKTRLFHIEDMMIRPGERVALLGHNGVGKTTLINRIMNCYRTNPDGDEIKFNPQCEIGYYDQELNLLDPAQGMMQTLRDHCGGSDSHLKTALIKAGFPFRELDKKVAVLSGGEKARLMFLLIKLNTPNFLILDEPTNHIDIQGKEELEEQILSTNATVLITSHDRRFVDNIAQRYLLISDGRLQEINSPEAFYAAEPTSGVQPGQTGKLEAAADSEPDDILSRIVELEQLLEDDLARKPKFQKPKLQAKWKEEIEALNKRL